MKVYSSVIIAALLMLSCGKSKESINKTKQQDSILEKQDTSWQDSNENDEYYSYEGVLPDENGKAKQTTLQIAKDYQTFQLIEKTLFNKTKLTDDTLRSIKMEGNLNTERGYEKDENATVYILNWDKPDNLQRLFVRSTGNDKQLFEIGIDRKRKKPNDKWILIYKD
jgi:copper homeostasis protein (lipoprotein)